MGKPVAPRYGSVGSRCSRFSRPRMLESTPSSDIPTGACGKALYFRASEGAQADVSTGWCSCRARVTPLLQQLRRSGGGQGGGSVSQAACAPRAALALMRRIWLLAPVDVPQQPTRIVATPCLQLRHTFVVADATLPDCPLVSPRLLSCTDIPYSACCDGSRSSSEAAGKGSPASLRKRCCLRPRPHRSHRGRGIPWSLWQIYASEGFFQMTGYTREEAIGHNW